MTGIQYYNSLQLAVLLVKREVFEVRVTDDDDARLKHVAHLHALLPLRALPHHQLPGLVRCRLHLELLHIVDIKVRRPDL